MRRLSVLGLFGILSCADHGANSEESRVLGDAKRADAAVMPVEQNDISGAASRKRVRIGSVAAVLEGVRADSTDVSKRYTFPAGPFGQIRVMVDDFYHVGGKLSMVGRALDSTDSQFMLKADERRAYGWVVYRDQNVAFEYTTDESGALSVEEVPVSKIFPVCNFQSPAEDVGDERLEAPPQLQQLSPMMPAHIGMYPDTDVTKLQSLPGAEKVWYIDITDVMDGSTPIGQTREDVWKTWQSLAATLSAYDVNVTTDADIYAATEVTNSGVAKMHDIDEGSSSCGLNVFGSRSACNVHRYRNGYATGRILAHEVGHGVGMRHDGGENGGEYFNGFSEFQWTPLMGNVWPGDRWENALYQWSKGEYATATQKEDDFANIAEHFEYREDDIPSVSPLRIQGTSVALASNWGQIGRNTDTDSFSFKVGAAGGHATLKIDRIEYLGGAMLDVDASIVGASNMVMAQHNAKAARHAELDVPLPAGDYTLVIKGGAEGDLMEGFTNYSSVGFYGIEGTITGADAGNGGAGNGGAGGLGAGAGSGGVAGSGGASSAGTGGVASTGGGGSPASGGTVSGGTSGAPHGGSVAGSGLQNGPASNGRNDESGCGCRVAGMSSSGAGWWLSAGLLVFLRRRRASHARPGVARDSAR